jgi:hypothetical protein
MKVYAVRRVYRDKDPIHVFDSKKKAQTYVRERTRKDARDYGEKFSIRGYKVE